MTYKQFINKLQKSENFSFARYGDGEFNAILGPSAGQNSNMNCDGHRYFKDMGIRLYKILESKPPYIMGLQPMAQRLRGGQADFEELLNGINWIDADVLHKQSIKTNGNLSELFKALQQRDVILVANENLIPMSGYIFDINLDRYYNQIVISSTDCWLEYKDILKRLNDLIITDVVILYCASMASEVLIDDIWNKYGDSVTQIDIGSLFDPFVGEKTRSYHRNLKL